MISLHTIRKKNLVKHEHLGLINSSKKSKKKGNNDCHLTKAYQLSHTHVRSNSFNA